MPLIKIIMGTIKRSDRKMSFGINKVIVNHCHQIQGIGFNDIAFDSNK